MCILDIRPRASCTFVRGAPADPYTPTRIACARARARIRKMQRLSARCREGNSKVAWVRSSLSRRAQTLIVEEHREMVTAVLQRAFGGEGTSAFEFSVRPTPLWLPPPCLALSAACQRRRRAPTRARASSRPGPPPVHLRGRARRVRWARGHASPTPPAVRSLRPRKQARLGVTGPLTLLGGRHGGDTATSASALGAQAPSIGGGPQVYSASGDRRDVLFNATPRFDGAGSIVGVFGVGQAPPPPPSL